MHKTPRFSEEELKRINGTVRAEGRSVKEQALAPLGALAAPSPYKRVAVNIKGPFIFTLPMQIPSGKNAVQITRTGKRYPNKRFKAWREEAIRALPVQMSYFGDPVGLTVNYTPGDKIRRDVPGLLDALCHLIEHVGIVLDDAQVKNVHWTTFPVCKGKAKCEVEIYELWQGVNLTKEG